MQQIYCRGVLGTQLRPELGTGTGHIGHPKKSAPESRVLDTTEKRAAQSGAIERTQRMADGVAQANDSASVGKRRTVST